MKINMEKIRAQIDDINFKIRKSPIAPYCPFNAVKSLSKDGFEIVTYSDIYAFRLCDIIETADCLGVDYKDIEVIILKRGLKLQVHI